GGGAGGRRGKGRGPTACSGPRPAQAEPRAERPPTDAGCSLARPPPAGGPPSWSRSDVARPTAPIVHAGRCRHGAALRADTPSTMREPVEYAERKPGQPRGQLGAGQSSMKTGQAAGVLRETGG